MVEYSAVTYAVEPELFCSDSVEVAEPPEQLPSDCESVRLTAVGPEEQPEALIVIDESAVVLVVGSRKSFDVFSAYQLITTAAPLD